MGAAIGQVLPMSLGVALSPLPIIDVVLILATPHSRINGAASLASRGAGDRGRLVEVSGRCR